MTRITQKRSPLSVMPYKSGLVFADAFFSIAGFAIDAFIVAIVVVVLAIRRGLANEDAQLTPNIITDRSFFASN